jgi:hypothetical protein
VVGLGAVCDLHPQSPADARDQSFTVGEFVALEDGRRVMLHDERGLTIGVRSGAGSDPGHVRDSLSLEQLTEAVLNVVLPDDDERDEEHPWEWLAHLARARGLEVTADDLRGLPYEVTFTDAVRRWLDA